MPASDERLRAIEALLEGAALWGVELDPDYRVGAATFEVPPDHRPEPLREDGRVQLVFHPVTEFACSLRRPTPEGLIIETFAVEHLVAIVESFDGPVPAPPLFGRPAPAPGEWGPRLTLEGRSQALDGRAHAFSVHLEDDGRMFDLRLTFDDVDVRDATGAEVDPTP